MKRQPNGGNIDSLLQAIQADNNISTVKEYDLASTVYDLDLTCDACSFPIEWEDEECYNCKAKWNEAYWDEKWAQERTRLFDKMEANDAAELPLSALEYIAAQESKTICCEKHAFECKCDVHIPGDSTDHFQIEVYDQDDLCMNCVWAATSSCPPLRALAKEVFTAQDDSFLDSFDLITPCAEFTMIPLPFDD